MQCAGVARGWNKSNFLKTVGTFRPRFRLRRTVPPPRTGRSWPRARELQSHPLRSPLCGTRCAAAWQWALPQKGRARCARLARTSRIAIRLQEPPQRNAAQCTGRNRGTGHGAAAAASEANGRQQTKRDIRLHVHGTHRMRLWHALSHAGTVLAERRCTACGTRAREGAADGHGLRGI